MHKTHTKLFCLHENVTRAKLEICLASRFLQFGFLHRQLTDDRVSSSKNISVEMLSHVGVLVSMTDLSVAQITGWMELVCCRDKIKLIDLNLIGMACASQSQWRRRGLCPSVPVGLSEEGMACVHQLQSVSVKEVWPVSVSLCEGGVDCAWANSLKRWWPNWEPVQLLVSSRAGEILPAHTFHNSSCYNM